jgi:hypothetical protein
MYISCSHVFLTQIFGFLYDLLGINVGRGIFEDEISLHSCTYRAGILKKSMGARHRVGIGISYRPARLHRLAELMPEN